MVLLQEALSMNVGDTVTFVKSCRWCNGGGCTGRRAIIIDYSTRIDLGNGESHVPVPSRKGADIVPVQFLDSAGHKTSSWCEAQDSCFAGYTTHI